MERIVELIQHPERLDRDTLYELRSMLALYPYYQNVRLLMLQNLYLLHDPTFDEELPKKEDTEPQQAPHESRTLSLIDTFLDSIPKEEEKPAEPKRKPTPADAAVDYVAYLLETEGDQAAEEESIPEMPGQDLIDSFIKSDKRKFVLNEEPLLSPPVESVAENESEEPEEEYFTETLARIYIKQGRYSKALEIIQRLSLQVPKKNAYFADQIRFLEKLIINNNKNKK